MSSKEGSSGSKVNATPLGLCSFALSVFVLSCYNTGWFGVGVDDPVNVVLGLCVFYGGLSQGIAGMWEFHSGHTLSATAFTSYSAFWLSYSFFLIPQFGIITAYSSSSSTSPQTLHNALGIFLLGWAIFTMLLLVVSLRTNVALFALFLGLFLTFLILAISEFSGGNQAWKRTGGLAGFITGGIAWYTAFAGLLAEHQPPLLNLPVGNIFIPASP